MADFDSQNSLQIQKQGFGGFFIPNKLVIIYLCLLWTKMFPESLTF